MTSSIIKFFDLVTEKISAEKCVTLSRIRIIHALITKKVNSYDSDKTLQKKCELVEKLQLWLQDKFSYKESDIVKQATLFDLGFIKKKWIE